MARNHKNSILIVDDEFVVRDSLTKWFRQDGYRTEGRPGRIVRTSNDGAGSMGCRPP